MDFFCCRDLVDVSTPADQFPLPSLAYETATTSTTPAASASASASARSEGQSKKAHDRPAMILTQQEEEEASLMQAEDDASRSR